MNTIDKFVTQPITTGFEVVLIPTWDYHVLARGDCLILRLVSAKLGRVATVAPTVYRATQRHDVEQPKVAANVFQSTLADRHAVLRGFARIFGVAIAVCAARFLDFALFVRCPSASVFGHAHFSPRFALAFGMVRTLFIVLARRRAARGATGLFRVAQATVVARVPNAAQLDLVTDVDFAGHQFLPVYVAVHVRVLYEPVHQRVFVRLLRP